MLQTYLSDRRIAECDAAGDGILRERENIFSDIHAVFDFIEYSWKTIIKRICQIGSEIVGRED